MQDPRSRPASRRALIELGTAVRLRRQVCAAFFAAAGLPLLTLALTSARTRLSLADDLLLYLLVVVVVAVVGGFWPAVLTAAISFLLLNWYLTPPVHTLTIERPENLLALLLFVAVAMIVSSVVHLSARRAADAAKSSADAATLLELARTVLAGADTPTSVLSQLTGGRQTRAELLERVSGAWAPVAVAGTSPDQLPATEPVLLELRSDLRLKLSGEGPSVSRRVLEGVGAQAAAALDRERLRTQAAHAEALGEANRVRTALLTAVSHDLRTPLASVKAAITSLRLNDVTWSPEDEAALLATIEEGSDRLEALINNLLDMSRIHTGSLQPFLRPTALDEVVPLALRGVAEADIVDLDIPDTLPLVGTDAALLERVLANLISNAVHHSGGQAVRVTAEADASVVQVSVVDHGPGVPDGERSRMFEPFQRLGDRPAGSGVGLGLAVARGLTEAMGGRIRASATPGGGLTMTVELRTAVLVGSR